MELTREGDGSHSILGGGGIAVGKVGVRWVCTIDNMVQVYPGSNVHSTSTLAGLLVSTLTPRLTFVPPVVKN